LRRDAYGNVFSTSALLFPFNTSLHGGLRTSPTAGSGSSSSLPYRWLRERARSQVERWRRRRQSTSSFFPPPSRVRRSLNLPPFRPNYSSLMSVAGSWISIAVLTDGKSSRSYLVTRTGADNPTQCSSRRSRGRGNAFAAELTRSLQVPPVLLPSQGKDRLPEYAAHICLRRSEANC